MSLVDLMETECPSWKVDFPIFNLPLELILCVLSSLQAKDLCNAARSCRAFYTLCEENTIWKAIAEKKWHFQGQVKVASWKRYYFQRNAIMAPRLGTFSWQLPPWKVLPADDPLLQQHLEKVPSPRMAHTGCSVSGNRIVYIGGQVTPTQRFNDIYIFNTDTMEFTKPVLKRGVPPVFARHTAAAINNKVYCFGGFDGISTLYGVAVFDVDELTWDVPEVYGDIPSPRTNHACTSLGSKIYIHGGNVTVNDVYTVLGDFYAFDTTTNVWEKIKASGDVPSGRSSHRMVTVGNKLYLFGGGVWTPTPHSRWITKFNDIYSFDPETNVWTKLKTQGEVRVCTFTMTFALGPFIFVFGGQSTVNDFCTNNLFCFDTVSHTWTEIMCEATELPKKRDVGAINICGDYVVLFAGSSGGPINDLNILRPSFKISELFPCLK